MRISQELAAAAVLVDAKDQAALQFYARHGFQHIPHMPNRLSLSMQTIKPLFGKS